MTHMRRALDRDAHLLGRRQRFADPARPVVRRAVDHRGRLEGDRLRHRRRAAGAVARGVAGLVRRRASAALLMGRIANSYGIRWTVITGAVMIAIGLVHFVARRAVAALCRPRPVHGPARQRRTQRAAVRLCQPLVRPPPRLGARADLERRLSRGLRLADHLRALDRVFRLALDHDRVCDPSARGHRAARDHLPAPAAGAPARHRRRPPKGGRGQGVRLATQRRVRHARAGGASCAASPCRCRSSTWLRSAATSAFPRRVGATMLSVLLGMGFFSRQGWGWLSDRMGGVLTALSAR